MKTESKKGGAIVLIHREESFHTALRANLAPGYSLESILEVEEGLNDLVVGLRPKIVLVKHGMLDGVEEYIFKNWKFTLPEVEIWAILPTIPGRTINDFLGMVNYYTSIGVKFVIMGADLVPLMQSQGFCSQRPPPPS